MGEAGLEQNGYLRRNSLISIGIGVAGLILPVMTTLVIGLVWTTQELSRLKEKVGGLELSASKSSEDRSHLTKQGEDNRLVIAELKQDLATEQTERVAANREIETQFHALSESMNSSLATLHRANAIAWPKIPGLGPYPTGPYVFSNISNRDN